MKQVVFAIALLAMASLTGCLNTEDSPVDDKTDDTTSDTTDDNTDTTENNSDTTEDNSDTTDDTKDDELIEPVGTDGGYTPPENSNVRVDNGFSGYWVKNTSSNYYDWVACSKQGYSINAEEENLYCDIDERQDKGAQTWVNKTGNSVTVECIKSIILNQACKDRDTNYNGNFYITGVHIMFTSIEGFQEIIFVTLAETSITQPEGIDEFNNQFFKTEIELPFEPVSFTISPYAGANYGVSGFLPDGVSYALENEPALSSSIDYYLSPAYSSTRYF